MPYVKSGMEGRSYLANQIAHGDIVRFVEKLLYRGGRYYWGEKQKNELYLLIICVSGLKTFWRIWGYSRRLNMHYSHNHDEYLPPKRMRGCDVSFGHRYVMAVGIALPIPPGKSKIVLSFFFRFSDLCLSLEKTRNTSYWGGD